MVSFFSLHLSTSFSVSRPQRQVPPSVGGGLYIICTSLLDEVGVTVFVSLRPSVSSDPSRKVFFPLIGPGVRRISSRLLRKVHPPFFERSRGPYRDMYLVQGIRKIGL